MAVPQQGFFLIADITGYTAYLSGSELDHAQDTLAALLELLIQHTRPPLILSRLAGDAVISYGLRDNFFRGQTFVEMIEDTYIAFRTAIERMVLNNTCQCNACLNVSSLDLKFFVHYGTFSIQRLSAHNELVGSDVNLIHRLLKNQVVEKTGIRAYTLYSAAAVRQLEIEEISRSMVPYAGEYEHLGKVETWVQDMHPIWQRKRATTSIRMAPEENLLRVETDISMPPEMVWNYLTEPEHRKVLIGSDRQEILSRKEGRVAPGSVYQCYHGDKIVPQTILEWRPFEQITTQDLMPIPIPNTTTQADYLLVPTEAGTRLIQAIGRPGGPLVGRMLVRLYAKFVLKTYQKDIDGFKKHIESIQAVRGGTQPAGPEIAAEAISAAAGASLGVQ